MPAIYHPVNWVMLLIIMISEMYSTDVGVCPKLIRKLRDRPVNGRRTVWRWQDYCNWRGGCNKIVTENYVYYESYYETRWELECCKGFHHYNSATHTCQPSCTNDCEHGKCIGADRCECNTGYNLINRTKCVSHCEETCYNGKCISPNICECEPGFEFVNGSQNECLPTCTKGCINGACVKPEKCECYEGYRKSDPLDNTCDPICINPCENATCIAPNVCSCMDGYVQVNQWSCKPLCQNDCHSRGICIKPGVCSCPEGYESSDCSPGCPTSCYPGHCTQPGICSCPPRFTFKDDTCKPVCDSGCVNGTCFQPGQCKCWKGYVGENSNQTSSVCAPYCNPPCIGGSCIKPGICSCNEGLLRHPLVPNICLWPANNPHNYSFLMDMFHVNLLDQLYSKVPFYSISLISSCSKVFSELSDDNNEIRFFCSRINKESPIEITYICDFSNGFFQNKEFSTVNDKTLDYLLTSISSTELTSTTDEALYSSFPTDLSSTTELLPYESMTTDPLLYFEDPYIGFSKTDISNMQAETEITTTSDGSTTSENPITTDESIATEETTTEVNSEKKYIFYLITPQFYNASKNESCSLCAHLVDPIEWTNPDDRVYIVMKECPKPLSDVWHSSAGAAFWTIIFFILALLIGITATALKLIRQSLNKGRSYNCQSLEDNSLVDDQCQLEIIQND